MPPTLDARVKNRKIESPKVRLDRPKSPVESTVSSVVDEDDDSPGVYMPIPMIVRYGENKDLYVNPNAGFASVMDYVRGKLSTSSIVSDGDHIELCDEKGLLLNPDDFPNMMFMTSFIKPGSEEATFYPAKVERDEGKKVVKLDVLLKDPEHSIPEAFAKLKKDYHILADGRTRTATKKDRMDVAPSSPKTEKRGQTPMPFEREPSVTKSTVKKTARRSREKSRGGAK